MVIETSRFGTIEAGDDSLINFTEGMLGFSKLREYVLVESDDDSLFVWLQSVKRGAVAFPLLEPQIFDLNYEIELEAEDQKELKLGDLRHAKVFTIVTVPTDPSKMTANLRAPLVVNLKEKLAKQVILLQADYAIRHPVFADVQRFCSTHSRDLFASGEGETPFHAVPIREGWERVPQSPQP